MPQEYRVRHAPESRFEYWRNRMDTKAAFREREATKAEHARDMAKWPDRKAARQSLNLEHLVRADANYKVRNGLRGKSPYIFHKSAFGRIGGKSVPLLNVVHIMEGSYRGEEDDNEVW
jgi:hypothetical protein